MSTVLRANFNSPQRHTEADAMAQIRHQCEAVHLSPEQTQRVIERARKSFRECPPTPYAVSDGLWARALLRLYEAVMQPPASPPQPPRNAA
jgi:hypothetical protein